MYNQTQWQDRVTEFENRFRETQNPDGTFTHTPVDGEVIQVGTPQNQTNFNNIENGIQDVTIAWQFLAWDYLQKQHLVEEPPAEEQPPEEPVVIPAEEVHTVTLTNTEKLPFNTTVDTPRTVALNSARNNTSYSVETEITARSGPVGEIIISDKALNGFKISYTGSGKSVTVVIRINGGIE